TFPQGDARGGEHHARTFSQGTAAGGHCGSSSGHRSGTVQPRGAEGSRKNRTPGLRRLASQAGCLEDGARRIAAECDYPTGILAGGLNDAGGIVLLLRTRRSDTGQELLLLVSAAVAPAAPG